MPDMYDATSYYLVKAQQDKVSNSNYPVNSPQLGFTWDKYIDKKREEELDRQLNTYYVNRITWDTINKHFDIETGVIDRQLNDIYMSVDSGRPTRAWNRMSGEII